MARRPACYWDKMDRFFFFLFVKYVLDTWAGCDGGGVSVGGSLFNIPVKLQQVLQLWMHRFNHDVCVQSSNAIIPLVSSQIRLKIVTQMELLDWSLISMWTMFALLFGWLMLEKLGDFEMSLRQVQGCIKQTERKLKRRRLQQETYSYSQIQTFTALWSS